MNPIGYKKRILIFSTAYLPLVGGAEIAVKEITDRLPNYEFTLITARLKKDLLSEEKIGNLQVYRIGRGDNLDKFRLIFSGSGKAMGLGKFDGVWSIMASYAGLAALKYKKRFPETPLLLTLQEGDSLSHIYSRMIFCWRAFLKLFQSADRVQVISHYLGGWARKMGARCPIDVIPNGVDLDKFKRTPKLETVNIKEELKIQNTDKVVVTVSRLEKKNGIEDLIAAMKFLDTNVRLLILGTGSLEGKLRGLAGRLGVIDRVHFLGNIPHNAVPTYLWSSDVFCRPSLSEGLGNAFLEAMEAGLPVVATPVGGIPDFLKDRETGLFCKVGDPRDIADKIRQFLADDELRKKITTNSVKMVEEKYNWSNISQEFDKLFKQLIK